MLRPVPCARTAGILYLIIIVCGVSAGVLRESIGVPGAETAATFRLTILLDAAMAIADVGLAVLLFYLLLPVSRMLSTLAMTFRLTQAAILGMNLVNLAMAAQLGAQGDPLAEDYLSAHANGFDIGLFFFAVNCFLTGYLVMRAAYFPKLIGVLIGISGVIYLAGSTIRIAAPHLSDPYAPVYGFVLLAELAFCIYLLTKGLNQSQWPSTADSVSKPLAASA